MQIFSVDATMFLKKIKKIFLPTKSWKNNPKNLLTYGSWEFFLCSPDCPKQPKTSFMFCKFFYPIISARISGCPVGPQYKSLVTFFYVANWYPFRPLCNTHGGDFLLGGWQRGGKSHVSSWVSVKCQSEKIRWGTCAKLVCSLIFLPSRHGKPDLLTWP